MYAPAFGSACEAMAIARGLSELPQYAAMCRAMQDHKLHMKTIYGTYNKPTTTTAASCLPKGFVEKGHGETPSKCMK